MSKSKGKKKRKKLKWFLLSFLVIVLAVGGYILYEFKLKTYDVADKQVDAIIDDGFTLALPDGTEMKVDAKGKIQDETVSGKFKLENEDVYVVIENNRIVKVIDVGGQEITHNAVKPNLTVEKKNNQVVILTEDGGSITVKPGKPAVTEPEQKPTVASIKGKYASSFSALQSQAESKLYGLVGLAQEEYSNKKKNGESVSFGYFYNKYMGAASGMEASTDAAFESLMGVVESDLENNGFNKSYAASFRTEYEGTKESLRSQLYNKALSMK
jgi:hypothetical protein